MTNKKLKVGNVPNLRFPGFEDEWEVRKLGEIATNVMYGMNAAATGYDGKNQYIRITDIDENSRLFIPNPLSSPDGELDNKYLLHKGDILFARTGASVGKSYLYNENDGKIYFAGFLIRLNVKTENPYFIFSQTLTEKYQKWVLTMSMRSGQPGINAEEYKLLPIVIPSIQEQKKISSFLSLVDKRIQTQNKIIKELDVSKTTFAKKIFSGQLKFKDDSRNPFQEWKIKTLGEIGKFSGGGTPTSSNVDFWNGDIPWVSSSDLSENNIHSINITRFITESAVNNSATKFCKAPLILIVSRVGVGKVAYSKESLCTSQDFLNIHDFSCNGIFLAYLLSIEMKKAASNTQGTSIKGISSVEIKSKKILLPSISEQAKIANFLSSIDSKIDIEIQLLQKLEEQKKFLLQQLFI